MGERKLRPRCIARPSHQPGQCRKLTGYSTRTPRSRARTAISTQASRLLTIVSQTEDVKSPRLNVSECRADFDCHFEKKRVIPTEALSEPPASRTGAVEGPRILPLPLPLLLLFLLVIPGGDLLLPLLLLLRLLLPLLLPLLSCLSSPEGICFCRCFCYCGCFCRCCCRCLLVCHPRRGSAFAVAFAVAFRSTVPKTRHPDRSRRRSRGTPAFALAVAFALVFRFLGVILRRRRTICFRDKVGQFELRGNQSCP